MEIAFEGEYLVLFAPVFYNTSLKNRIFRWILRLIFRGYVKKAKVVNLLKDTLYLSNIKRIGNFKVWQGTLCIRVKSGSFGCNVRNTLYDVIIVDTHYSSLNEIKKIFEDIKKSRRKDSFRKTTAFFVSFCNESNLGSKNYLLRKNIEVNRFIHILNKDLFIDERFNISMLLLKNTSYVKYSGLSKKDIFYEIVLPVIKVALLVNTKKVILENSNMAEKIHESSFEGWFSKFIYYTFVIRSVIIRSISYAFVALLIFVLSVILPHFASVTWRRVINLKIKFLSPIFRYVYQIIPKEKLTSAIFQFTVVVSTVFLLALYISLFINRFKDREARLINSIFSSDATDTFLYYNLYDKIIIRSFLDLDSPGVTFRKALQQYYDKLNRDVLYKIKFNRKSIDLLLRVLINRFVTGEQDSLVYILRRL